MLAVSTGSRAIGQWTMYPVNAASEEFLVRSVHQLVVEQRFPEATPLSVITPISVILKGDLTGSEFAPRRRFWKRGPVIDSFQLDLLDLAGEAFAYDPERQIPSDTADAAIDNIADAQGLVYFFDPVSEFDRRSSAEYMYSPLVRLLGRMKGQASDRFLPQQVSVCMTKFDHPRIFMQIKQLGLLDENFRVSDRNAKRIFDMYCEGRFSSDDERSYASAQFIRNQLQTYFAPDNVRYFVTSSVGLHRQSANFDDLAGFPRIDPDDFANVYSQHGGLMIRGPIEPINVLEPLISIQQRIRRGRNKA